MDFIRLKNARVTEVSMLIPIVGCLVIAMPGDSMSMLWRQSNAHFRTVDSGWQ